MPIDDYSSAPTEGGAAHDTVERFAADLRKLRLEADSPTLAKLQSATGISRTVLSDAFAGRQLPSARTVDSVARACLADPHEWVDRRDALAERARRAAAPVPADFDTGAPSEAVGVTVQPEPDHRRGVSRRGVAWLMAGAFGVGVVATALVTTLLVPLLSPTAPAQAAGPRVVVENGSDPALTTCVDDARVATSETRADDTQLQIVWSDACQAGWGRIKRFDGLGAGNTVTIAIYPQTSPSGPDRQEATEHDVDGAYTFLVVRPSPDTLLCADGSFTVDGKSTDLGDPLCI